MTLFKKDNLELVALDCQYCVLALGKPHFNAAFKIACRSLLCLFDGDICTTAQAPFAVPG